MYCFFSVFLLYCSFLFPNVFQISNWEEIHVFPFWLFSGLALMESSHSSKPSQFILKQKEELQREMEDLLGTDGVLFYPSHPLLAPKHHHPLFTPYNFAYTGNRFLTNIRNLRGRYERLNLKYNPLLM